MRPDTYDTCQRIERYARALGYEVHPSGFALSELSTSGYVRVALPGAENWLRLRVSDHAARPTYEALHGVADYEIGEYGMAHGTWAECVAWLAQRASRPIPGPVRRILTLAQRRAERIHAAASETLAANAAARADYQARYRALPEEVRAEYETRLARADAVAGRPRKRLRRTANDWLAMQMNRCGSPGEGGGGKRCC